MAIIETFDPDGVRAVYKRRFHRHIVKRVSIGLEPERLFENPPLLNSIAGLCRITEERYQKQTEADGGQEYSSEIEKLHREQYDFLPEDERYTGTESVEGLLEKKASGEILDGREENYLKIFANLHDYERATANGRLRSILFPKIQEALEKAGIDVQDKEYLIDGYLWEDNRYRGTF